MKPKLTRIPGDRIQPRAYNGEPLAGFVPPKIAYLVNDFPYFAIHKAPHSNEFRITHLPTGSNAALPNWPGKFNKANCVAYVAWAAQFGERWNFTYEQYRDDPAIREFLRKVNAKATMVNHTA